MCGMENADDDSDLSIEWKPGRIVVTVRGDAAFLAKTIEEEEYDDESDFILMDSDEEEDDDFFGDLVDEEGADADVVDDDDIIDEIDVNDSEEEDAGVENNEGTDDLRETDDGVEEGPARRGEVDLALLARAINAALDDDGIGLAIAESHEIEVTTPGAQDELTGDVMFQAYRGFEVICQQVDPKTQKVKTIEGRLVERNSEFTILNIKGRTKKMRNGTVLSVKLPKAKKEKGGG